MIAAEAVKKLDLATQPQVLAGLMQLDDDSEMSFKELGRLIKSDQNIARVILNAANSSLYYRGHEIRTLEHAIAMMGFRLVRAIALSGCGKNLFATGNYARFREQVWRHSLVTAVIARRICEHLGHKELVEEAFIGGLLHDIGKVILNSIDRKKFIAVVHAVVERDVAFVEAEREIFGYTHLEAAEAAVQAWHLPSVYHPVLCAHEDPDDAAIAEAGEGALLLYVVGYGNWLAKLYGYGHLAPGHQDPGEFFRGRLGLSETDAEYFESEYRATIQNDPFYEFFITLMA